MNLIGFKNAIQTIVEEFKKDLPEGFLLDESTVEWLEKQYDEEYKQQYRNASAESQRSVRFWIAMMYGQCLANIFDGQWIPFSNAFQDWGIRTNGDCEFIFNPFGIVHQFLLGDQDTSLVRVVYSAKVLMVIPENILAKLSERI